MNSNDANFDWHHAGVWLALGPKGSIYWDTVASTPRACCGDLVRSLNRSWDSLKIDGFVIQQYEPAIPVLTDVIKVGDQVAVAAQARWYYPANGEAAPAGVTVQLLTRGGISVRGTWNDLGDYIAWAPMIKRDKELEERLGL